METTLARPASDAATASSLRPLRAAETLAEKQRRLAEAEKRRLDIDPATGEELESLAKEVMTAPPDVVEKVKKILGM